MIGTQANKEMRLVSITALLTTQYILLLFQIPFLFIVLICAVYVWPVSYLGWNIVLLVIGTIVFAIRTSLEARLRWALVTGVCAELAICTIVTIWTIDLAREASRQLHGNALVLAVAPFATILVSGACLLSFCPPFHISQRPRRRVASRGFDVLLANKALKK
jgi:hypothetical protein